MGGSKKKKDKIFILLSKIAGNLKEGGRYFHDFKVQDSVNLEEFQKQMRIYETESHDFVDKVIKELNNTFITPIEREDALELAIHMTDILDGLEQCSARFYMFNILHIDEYMVKFSDLINLCIDEICVAIDLLTSKKLTQIRQNTIKIKEYEDNCDILERKAIKELFENQKDIARLIQYKEIYELLENTADACQKVAKRLETVVMKNA